MIDSHPTAADLLARARAAAGICDHRQAHTLATAAAKAAHIEGDAPTLYDAHRVAGRSWIDRGQARPALVAFRLAVDVADRFAEVAGERGRALHDLATAHDLAGHTAAALDFIARALRAYPGDHPWRWCAEADAAWFQMTAGDDAGAAARLPDLVEAARGDGRFWSVAGNLCIALARAGRRGEAQASRADLLRSLNDSPCEAWGWYAWARSGALLGIATPDVRAAAVRARSLAKDRVQGFIASEAAALLLELR